MARTALQIIGRALRLCQVLDSNEAAEAQEAIDALEVLNGMLAEWHEAGIGLPDYGFDTLTEELSTDAADREAVAYQLALRLAPEYGRQVAPEVAMMAEACMGRLRLRYFQPGKVDFSELPGACAGGFNITTGDV